MTGIRWPVIAAVLAAAAPVAAQVPHWYAGVAGGEARTSHDLVANRESAIVNGSAVSSGFDAADAGWKLFGGWRLNDYFALEASYTDLGKSHLVTHTVSVDRLEGSIDIRRRISGFGIDAVVSAPLGSRFAVFGRAGAVRTHLKEDASLDGGIVFTNEPADERSRTVTSDETVGHFGVGGEWRLRNDLSLRLEWERFHDVGKAFQAGASGTTGEADTDLVSLGVLLRF